MIYSLLTLDDFGEVAVVFLGARDGTVFDDLDRGVIPKSISNFKYKVTRIVSGYNDHEKLLKSYQNSF